MLTCTKCNNTISNVDAKFCDNCGEFLKLSNSKIRFKENISNKKLKEFKKVLIESVDTVFDSYTDSTWNNETIISYLIDLTTIGKVFEREELNYIGINDILSRLKRSSKDLILYEFLVKVNEFFESETYHDKETVNVIIYTNVDKKLKDNEHFNELLNFFNLEIFEFEEYRFKKNQYECRNNFNSRFLMFKFSKNTRDYDLAKSQALGEIYSLFGYLTYLNMFNKSTGKSHINELSLTNQISDFECNALIVTTENNGVLKFDLQNRIITNSKKISKSKIKGIKSVELIKDFNRPDKKKISSKIKEYFHLYYLASSESSLENSFLKYWSLSEKIIKDIYDDIKDSKLRSVMRNILKANGCPKHIIKRVDFIYVKRNNFVHENKHGEITQYDQTLVKLISERLIDFLIHLLDEIKYLDEYSVILDYVNKDDAEKRRLVSLIELTMGDFKDN